MTPFQNRVRSWLVTRGISTVDEHERALRLLKKTVELVRHAGLTDTEIAEVVVESYTNPINETEAQSLGGVMVTAAGYAVARGLDLERAAETELERIKLAYPPVSAAGAEGPPEKSLEERVKDVRNCHAIQMDPGNALADEYMRGMANGLELAMAILDGREVAYINPPDSIVEVAGLGSIHEPPAGEEFHPTSTEDIDADIRAYEAAASEPTPAPQKVENDGEILSRLGTDGLRWAEAFAERFDVPIDEAHGWFANAIEAGRRAENERVRRILTQLEAI